MTTVGQLLTQARRKKRLSLLKLTEKTKIKPDFLVAIEKDQWQILPNFATAAGFVRSFATIVGIEPNTAVALLRRDFPPEIPKRQTASFPVWTPRTTQVVAIILVGGAIFTYLFWQYKTFVAPPPLSVSFTRHNDTVEISGKTNPQATIVIGGQPVLVNDDGSFLVTATAQSGQKITIEARSRGGKTTKQQLTIP